MTQASDNRMKELGMFWWTFAVRGGLAVLFSGVLFFSGNLFGTIFFDPIMIVILAVLLGFYVLAKAILLGVAAGYAVEHHIRLWRALFADCLLTTALGVYIGFSARVSFQFLPVLAGLHAFISGYFLAMLAIEVRSQKNYVLALVAAGVAFASVSFIFFTHLTAPTRNVTEWLAAFELAYGIAVCLLAAVLHRYHEPMSPAFQREDVPA
jgi:uncharacterized membrane protein HdeD (DUF308 family)